MCDTIVALPEATADGVVLFGKNSDRERNEAQSVEFVPRAEHAPGAKVACTYIAIPQARRTYAALLCRPFWLRFLLFFLSRLFFLFLLLFVLLLLCIGWHCQSQRQNGRADSSNESHECCLHC